jgi:hypothetical protein
MIDPDDAMTTYVRVRKYGGTYKERSGSIPHDAEEFMRVIQDALNEMPPEYLSMAKVNIEPEYELGEHYDCLEIGYYREMTAEEIIEYHAVDLRDWEDRLSAAVEHTDRCRKVVATLREKYTVQPTSPTKEAQ